MSVKSSSGQQSEEYKQWKDGLTELSICIDILKAVEGEKIS